MNLRKVLCLLVLLVAPIGLAFGQKKAKEKADAETEMFRYEVEQTTVSATTGDLNIRVYSFSKNPNVAEEQTKKNAIHACIYKGIPACADKPGSQKRPLITNADQEKAEEYFTNFFKDGGEYMRFVVLTSATPKITKIGKEYKVGVVVKVNYSELRKHLESNGILKGLASGF